MERLRVELGGERLDGVDIDPQGAGGVPLPGGVVFQEPLGHAGLPISSARTIVATSLQRKSDDPAALRDCGQVSLLGSEKDGTSNTVT